MGVVLARECVRGEAFFGCVATEAAAAVGTVRSAVSACVGLCKRGP